jgi:hypothetical protein
MFLIFSEKRDITLHIIITITIYPVDQNTNEVGYAQK